MAEGSIATDPGYSFLVSKIDEYQSASVMPVLDMRTYGRTFNFGFGAPDGAIIRTISMSNYDYGSDSYIEYRCQSYGGTLGNKQCANRVLGFCTGWKYDCTVPPESDWLLGFLAKNHSAAITVLDNLSDNCAADPADPDCKTAQARFSNALAICPDCLTALEYPKAFSVDPAFDAQGGYDQTLRGAILSWSDGAAPFDPESFKPNAALASLPAMKNVHVLVLNIDLSKAVSSSADLDDPANPADTLALESALNQSINLSRHVLQQASWPTIWKLTYGDGKNPSDPGIYSNPKFFAHLYAHSRELSLAGVIGVLLPPLDDGQKPQAVSSTDAFLLPAGKAVTDANTPFCAASGASAQFSHPTISAGLRKLTARDFGGQYCASPGSGACMPCSQAEIGLGICNPVCLDGSTCDSVYAPGTYKCAPNCISVQYCRQNLCQDSSAQITCTAARSNNQAPRACPNDPTNPAPDLSACDIATLPMSALANDILLPEAPQLIGGLPPGQACCLKGAPSPAGTPNPVQVSYYAYTSKANVQYAPEPDIFPKGGATTTDCGRNPPVDSDTTVLSCGGATQTPPPIGSTYWGCVISG